MAGPFQGFQDIPGVLGACVLVARQVVGTTLPGFSGKELLSDAIVPMVEALTQARALSLPLASVTVSYGDTRVLLADLGDGMLAVFYQDETDFDVLSALLEQERPQLVERARRLARQSGPLFRPGETSGSFSRPPFGKPQATLDSVGHQLDQVLEVLTLLLGPVASLLLDEAIDRWLEEGPPSRSRLPQLVEAILTAFPTEGDRRGAQAALQATLSL